MAVISYKCPNCGGDLRFDPSTQKYKCEYCISLFTQEELEAANPQASGEETAPHVHARGGQKAGQGGQESAQNDDGGKEEQGAVVYSCPGCGAEIVTDATTAATFCYYCHNPVVLKGRLSGEYEPDLVIPFAVDKKEAVEDFLKYVRGKKFVPKDFFCKEQIEKISGVYFPFWTYSCLADGQWQGSAQKVRVWQMGELEYTETKVYDVERRAELTFRNLTREALNKENRQLVEAVQPFRLEEAKDFSMGYLSGFFAEKRDIEKAEISAGVEQEVRDYAGKMLHSSVSGYMTTQTRDTRVHMQEETWKYLLLPVWVLTYRGADGKLYYYAMNGQTRKICGVLPIDKARMALLFLGVFLPLLLLLLMGGYFLW
ncbi:hypothetical protein BRYFOR_08603 [Marvinbryantia formatexigens DSM 14469]|uniref:TFIIB-type zinc ribbon-containing protein n=1 Tax=Marvinbryantia formatexigens DSM 14469 TaxID=478749 RepID=C6LIX2_9FIRM|nr:hypothetical protein [Marvinbryantia formatexigens]EET59511.1 hypothetical protein BRYFOR_08603 [Marvinbryantia formatexigens DSM 14469]UWO24013.1 TFIIB-type zinc ribbon-containing protein [Marvinbryantia formatexigens DSM 14469]SDG66628.1 hypothetical protein SAMN05660368_03035 [Marvinbryantia formatexigens]